jgi:hypothetical protein
MGEAASLDESKAFGRGYGQASAFPMACSNAGVKQKNPAGHCGQGRAFSSVQRLDVVHAATSVFYRVSFALGAVRVRQLS